MSAPKLSRADFIEAQARTANISLAQIQKGLKKLGQPLLNEAQEAVVHRILIDHGVANMAATLGFQNQFNTDLSDLIQMTLGDVNDWIATQPHRMFGELPKPAKAGAN